MFTLTIFKFEGRLVLGPVQQVPDSKRVKLSVKKQKNIWLLLKLLEK